MKIEKKKLAELTPAEYNPRKDLKPGDPEFEKLKRSMETFGYVEPIIWNKRTGNVVGGHQRLKVLEATGAEDAECVVVDLSAEEEKALNIALNKVTGEWDDDKLAELLQDIDRSGFDVSLTGFDSAEIANISGKYSGEASGALKEEFIVAPFSVLDSRAGPWQKRKKKWNELLTSQAGRGKDLIGGGGLLDLAVRSGAKMIGTSIFDPCLCEILLHWFSPKGGKVIDPFAGGSVRGIVSQMLERTYYGNDLSKEQIDENEAGFEYVSNVDTVYGGKLERPHWTVGDSRNIDEIISERDFDLMLTCPPYADLEVYSDDPRDISNMDYESFLDIYREILKKAAGMLKPDSFACVVVGEVRDKDGIYRNFIGDTINAMTDAGMKYYNEIVLVTAIGTGGLIAGRQFEATRKVRNVHQKALCFYKAQDDKSMAAMVEAFEKTRDLVPWKKSILVFLKGNEKRAKTPVIPYEFDI